MRAEPAPAPPAASRWPARLGRLISAADGPAGGDYAGLPAWWGAEHWCAVEVPTQLALHPELLTAEHVAHRTLLAVARAHARYADTATGRGCRPTNERLAGGLGLSVRQVQRARVVLRRLGVLAVVRRGRSFMTRVERLQAWRRGSAHRRWAAEFALICHRHTVNCACAVASHVIPPRDSERCSSAHQFWGSSPPPKPKRSRKSGPPGRAHPLATRTVALIRELQTRIGWLRAAPTRRYSGLHRFAAAGWSAADVHAALDGLLAARGWSVPEQIVNPPAYLAALLKNLSEDAERPSEQRRRRLAIERQRRAWIWATTMGWDECEHGYLAGNLPHPTSGHMPCPFCRHADKARRTETNNAETAISAAN
jgi:hypothetical protein